MYKPAGINLYELKQIIMNSKIRVDFDFDANEPFLKIDLREGELADKALKNFMEQISDNGVEIKFGNSNNEVQLRIKAH